MNDNHSRHESKYIKRWITPSFLKAVKNFPIVVLTGSRQVGKSTFLRNTTQIKEWEYITLDDFDVLEAAEKDPGALLAGKKKLIIDEIQKAPRLLSAIKKEVDASATNKKYLLSGSANLLLMHKVSESLAGRAVYHVMRPFAFREGKGQEPAKLFDYLFSGRPLKAASSGVKEKLEDVVIKGFYPPAVVRFNEISAVISWIEGFVATFLERDLRQLSQIGNLSDFRRLMEILALRSGQMLNQTEVSRDAKIPQPTVHRYINLLETAFLLERLPVYSVNRTKRLIKTPKIYWNDCGLAAFLMGHHCSKDLKEAREWGGVFETLVFHHLRVWTSLKSPSPKIFYWRTTAGQEVDFVIEWGKKLIAVEVKASPNIKYSDAANLKIFMEEYPETMASVVVYAGESIKQIGKNIWAIPWHML